MIDGYARDLPFTLTNGTPVAPKRRHSAGVRRMVPHRDRRPSQIPPRAPLRADDRSDSRGSSPAWSTTPPTRWAAYLTSGFDDALAVTLDWYGGGLSGSVSRCTPGGVERLHDFRYPHSLGLFYAQVTDALGFEQSRHEGKVLGLAAHGDPHVLGPELLKRFTCSEGRLPLPLRHGPVICAGSRSSLSARACGRRIPVRPRSGVVRGGADHWLQKTGLHDVVLAGGVAANVKLNQRIADLEGVRAHLHLPEHGRRRHRRRLGAGLPVCARRVEPREWETCYLGPDFSDERMAEAIRGRDSNRAAPRTWRGTWRGCSPTETSWRASRARWSTGPRALWKPVDPLCGHGLRGQRVAESPPRAHGVHAVRTRDAGRALRERYLAVAELLRRRLHDDHVRVHAAHDEKSPAAVHVDGTARPQVLRRAVNPDFYAIVAEYHSSPAYRV